MNFVLISWWALAHRAVGTKQTLLTRDAQVDHWTCCILSCHLIHRLDMVTSCVCCRGCQDDQLIVQSDWSAGHKQDTHTTLHYKTLTKSFFFFSFLLFAPFRPHPSWSRSLTKEENLVHGSFRFQKRGRKHWTQSSDRKEDSESLNKSLPLSQIDTWLVLCLFHFLGGAFSLLADCLLFFFLPLHWSTLISSAQSIQHSRLKYTSSSWHKHTRSNTGFTRAHKIRNNHLQTGLSCTCFSGERRVNFREGTVCWEAGGG